MMIDETTHKLRSDQKQNDIFKARDNPLISTRILHSSIKKTSEYRDCIKNMDLVVFHSEVSIDSSSSRAFSKPDKELRAQN